MKDALDYIHTPLYNNLDPVSHGGENIRFGPPKNLEKGSFDIHPKMKKLKVSSYSCHPVCFGNGDGKDAVSNKKQQQWVNHDDTEEVEHNNNDSDIADQVSFDLFLAPSCILPW